MATITVKTSGSQDELIERLRKKLREGEVTFAYKKKSTDELRIARGTTNTSLFNYNFHSEKPKELIDQINYWDLEKNEWRSLKTENIIKIM